jgi:hypothetical protein
MNESSTPSYRQRESIPGSLNLIEHVMDFKVTDLTVQTPTSHRAPNSLTRSPSAPRWNSPEFLLYGFLFLFGFPMMVYSPIQLSFGKFVIPALVFLAEAECRIASKLCSVSAQTK